MSLARRHREHHDVLRGGPAPNAEPAMPAAPVPAKAKKPAAKKRSPSVSERRRDAAAAAASIVAAAANDNAPEERQRDTSPAAVQRLAMAEAKRKLKALQSIEHRAHLKRELLPQFEAWVTGVLDASAIASAKDPAFRAPQDDVVMNVLIWRLDVGDIDQAVDLFAFARDHGWLLPANFKRNLSTFVVEEAGEFANNELDAGRPAPLAPLSVLQHLVDQDDMPDEVRARLHKAIGREFARRAEAPIADGEPVMAGQKRARLEEALAQLQRAFELDKQSGVKGDIARLQKAIGKEPPAADVPPTIKSNSREAPPASS